MRELRVSRHGYSSCPGCGRFVRLEDEIEDTLCPFCGAGILDEAAMPPPGTLAHLATLPGRSGRVAAFLSAASPPPPPPRPRRDPDLDDDPASLPRNHMPEVDGPTPGHAVWELTLGCDLKCVHCGSRAGKVRTAELSTRECLDLARQLADLGIREVTLIGGEAYMRRDWHRIASEITSLGMGCSMTTGGRNFGPERLAQAVDAGISSIGVSIDGLETTHDAQRGVPGSWRAAVETSRRIAESPIRLATNSQLNLLSAAELPGIARLMRDIGSAAWQIHLTVAMGRAADRPDLLLQPDDLLEIFPLLVWVREQILDPAGIALAVANNIGYFGPYERALRYGGDGGVHWSSCTAGRQVIGIEADGKIKGCPSLATRSFTGGNVRERRLRDIVREAPELTSIGRRGPADLWGFCGTCYYAEICTGGCSWTTHSLLGRLGNNPYCIHRALTFEEQGLRERVVKVEPAPGEPFDAGRFEIRPETDTGAGAGAGAEGGAEGGEVPTVAGIPLDRAMAAGPDLPGLFDGAALARHLTRRDPDHAAGAGRRHVSEGEGSAS